MATTTAKIGYNPRGEHAAATDDYTYMDTVTKTTGEQVDLYECISPAYPGTVPAGTAITNATYWRKIVGGATGAAPVMVLRASEYAELSQKLSNVLYAITG